MESFMSDYNKGMLHSDIYQCFFYIGKVFGLYPFAGYKVNFCVKNIFQFMGKSNKPYPNAVVEIHQDIYITFFIKITTGVTAKQSQFRYWISLLQVGFPAF